MDVNKIRVFIVVCVAVIRIQGILGFCSEFQNETPVIRMCEANALSVGVDSSIYLDSVGAPILTKVECTCVLSFSGTGSLEIAYRANEDVPDCEIEFRMNSRTWGCKSESFSNTINQGSNNVTFIQKSEVSGVWQACLGLRSRFHSISVTCYPYRIYYAPDEVVNGVFSEWTERSACSATCGSGTQTWVRYCDNPAPRNGGELCLANNGTRTLEETEVRSCNLRECQVVNGGFGVWTASSMCSVTCGTGTQTWVRNCDSPAPSNGGELCLAGDGTRTLEETETRQCIGTACPVDGGYTSWSIWSTCTQSCDGGSQSRSRTCTDPVPQFGGQTCNGGDREVQECNSNPCPVDGGWSLWSVWSTCSITCDGGGIIVRNRTCNNPTPEHGGTHCIGDSKETESCGIENCPVNGNWGMWSLWNDCSKTCGGGGYRTRNRICNSPAPVYGGLECVGDSFEIQTCGDTVCPVNGGWGFWQSWSQCSLSCGIGTQMRYRNCDNPIPEYNGLTCAGVNSDTNSCYGSSCPVNGQWGQWAPWSTCSVSCATGTHFRLRECDSPAPVNGGQYCVGNDSEEGICTESQCPIDGIWGPWSPWSSCSRSCGNGKLSRTRLCNAPAPSYGGSECFGTNSDTLICNLQKCQINGNWGLWSPWSFCSITCGSGTISRIRECNNPEPMDGGEDCYGEMIDETGCDKNQCPVDGGVGPWSPWSTCSASCGTEDRSRIRLCDNPEPKYGGQMCSDKMIQTETCNITSCPGTGSSQPTASTQTSPVGQQPSQTTASSSSSTAAPATEASVEKKPDDKMNLAGVIGGVLGGLVFLLLLILLILCLVRRRRRKEVDGKRRPSTGPRSVRYFSQGDDVTVTENELYNYDGETPSHATNALFVGGIPETPQSPGYIPHFSTDTGDRYAVIMDSNRTKPKSKERPKLDTFGTHEAKSSKEANGDVRASTDTVKLADDYNEDQLGRGVENPGYDDNYIAPYDSADGETKPKTSTSSPYDYIDSEKLKRDDDDYENDKLAGDYATLPDDIEKTETDENEDNDRYKRFISSEPEESPDDGYMKSPKRETAFEFPDTN